jgi:hypothetical protein
MVLRHARRCWDWRQLYQALSQQLENTRLPSSNTSLNGFFSVMRNITVESSVSNQNKYTSFNSNSFVNVQILINSQNWFDEPLTYAFSLVVCVVLFLRSMLVFTVVF